MRFVTSVIPWAVMALAGLHAVAPAHADDAAPGADDAEIGKVTYFDLCGTAPVMSVAVNPSVLTVIQFSEPLYKVGIPGWPVELHRNPDSIELKPLGEAAPGHAGTLTVHTSTGTIISVDVSRVLDPQEGTRRAEVALCGEDDTLLENIKLFISESVQHQFQVAEQKQQRAPHMDALEFIRTVNRGYEETDRWREAERAVSNGDPLRARIVKVSHSGRYAAVLVDIANPGDKDLPLTRLRVLDKHGLAPGEQKVFQGEQPVPEEPGVLATVPAGSSTTLTVFIDHADAFDGEVGVQTSSQEGDAPKPAVTERWFIPVEDKPPPPPENVGTQTIYAKGMIGGMWLAESMPKDPMPRGGLKAAFLSGYGARLTYGIASILDFESEFVYASSGTAEFGDVKRSASLVRVQFGGLLRFGETYMPTVRAGLGLYGASQRRVMGGATERDIQVDLTLTGGVGLDIRLSEAWVFGGALSLDDPLNSDSRTLEFSLHLGVGWGP